MTYEDKLLLMLKGTIYVYQNSTIYYDKDYRDFMVEMNGRQTPLNNYKTHHEDWKVRPEWYHDITKTVPCRTSKGIRGIVTYRNGYFIDEYGTAISDAIPLTEKDLL